ncbi:TPA: ACT domain-containing protein [Bacillus anthracis]|uniref:ACT domain-containing protein n=1 Tax=Bacillus cereus group TaxID=86661 RepID=UPI001BB42980|nr:MULTISPECIES: ACT domain-containing protein [Bacillus cereus group]MEB9456585.1 ACT domain-containing protein [Bacillus anthracis]QUW28267.1 ACT domain-containing protein [Bacillus cereus]HDX9623841.1 ACT domain-containing protein [Bacillus anthracis]HDX9626143.1 ACT domain-containing protein [Bacillus anthracis]
MSHTFSLVIDNDPNVLLRISGIFARRSYYISSLNLNESEMELTAVCTEQEATLLVGQLKKLINVLQVNKL